ncbi:protein of unknown function [Burkholderia multivorans]
MNIELPLDADSQLAESGKPRMGALDHPSVTPKAVFALDAFAGDSSRDAASAQIISASTAVAILVGMHTASAVQELPTRALLMVLLGMRGTIQATARRVQLC